MPDHESRWILGVQHFQLSRFFGHRESALSLDFNLFQDTLRPRTIFPTLPKGRTRSTCIFAGCTLQVIEATLCAESSVVMYLTRAKQQQKNHLTSKVDPAIFGRVKTTKQGGILRMVSAKILQEVSLAAAKVSLHLPRLQLWQLALS